jgi:hypothetical protein
MTLSSSRSQESIRMSSAWPRTDDPAVVEFEELVELHHLVEMGPDWNEIQQIVVTLNRPSVTPRREEIADGPAP